MFCEYNTDEVRCVDLVASSHNQSLLFDRSDDVTCTDFHSHSKSLQRNFMKNVPHFYSVQKTYKNFQNDLEDLQYDINQTS